MKGGIEGGMDLLKRPCRKGSCSKKGGMGDFLIVFIKFSPPPMTADEITAHCLRDYGSLQTSRNLFPNGGTFFRRFSKKPLLFEIFVVSLHRITKSRLWKRIQIRQRKAAS